MTTVSVFDSPAVALLLELEDAAEQLGTEALTIAVTSAGRLRIAPSGILTPDRRAVVQIYRDALRVLVQICDEGVQARRQVFTEQLRAHQDPGSVPALRFRPTMEGEHICVSCGNQTDGTWCWRCQCAARLALTGSVPADWMPVAQAAKAA